MYRIYLFTTMYIKVFDHQLILMIPHLLQVIKIAQISVIFPTGMGFSDSFENIVFCNSCIRMNDTVINYIHTNITLKIFSEGY